MKRLLDQSLYEILEVAVDAPVADIEKAYERAKALYGPGSLATYTLVGPEDAALLAQRLEEARAVLCDPVARGAYNARLGVAAPPSEPAPPIMPTGTEVTNPGLTAAAPLLSGGNGAADPPPIQHPRVELPTRTPPPLADLAKKDGLPSSTFVPPDGAPWTGALIRQVREARGVTLVQLAERTRVTKSHLENIEGDRYAQLPATVYLRGILMSLCKELRLDGQKVARSYLELATAGADAAQKPR